jgi:hypothetical protein
MKKISITFLIILSIILVGCRKSNEEKAKDAIKIYLNENLDDISTYEPVKFGNLDTLKKLDLTGTSLKNSRGNSLDFEMFHSYRIKGRDGAKHLIKEYFKLNSKIEVIEKQSFSFIPLDISEMPELPQFFENEDSSAAH